MEDVLITVSGPKPLELTYSDSALSAVHRVLVRTRTQAYSGADTQDLARILDDAEYLVALMLHQGDEDDFRQHLEEFERKFAGFDGLVAGYDEAEGRKSSAYCGFSPGIGTGVIVGKIRFYYPSS